MSVRQVAVHALRAAGLSTRVIAELVHVSQTQVRDDGELAITSHLGDPAVVLNAEGRITEARLAGQLTAEQAQAAQDWIVQQTQPEYLAAQLRTRGRCA